MRLDHFNIRADDIDAVKDTMVRLLGLEVGPRPPFSTTGYWLYGDDYPIVHLSKGAETPGNSTGAINHLAFKDDDMEGLIQRLTEDGVEYEKRTVPDSGVRQIFFRINHDVMIEVDYDPET